MHVGGGHSIAGAPRWQWVGAAAQVGRPWSTPFRSPDSRGLRKVEGASSGQDSWAGPSRSQ